MTQCAVRPARLGAALQGRCGQGMCRSLLACHVPSCDCCELVCETVAAESVAAIAAWLSHIPVATYSGIIAESVDQFRHYCVPCLSF